MAREVGLTGAARAAVAVAMIGVSGTAAAGSGPWVIGPGDQSLYLGVESQRIDTLVVNQRSGTEDLDVDARITTFGVKGILSYGLASRLEAEVAVPYYRVWMARDDLPPCGGLGLGECVPTQGIGVIEGRVKALVADELAGSPVSVAAGGHLRLGAFTHDTRQRLTNLGEGSTDFGAFASVGLSRGLAKGYWSGFLELEALYRTPNTVSFPHADGDARAPGPELLASTDVLFAPTGTVALGPSASVLWRPVGLDWYELDFTDPDRFAVLRVLSPRIGGKLVLRGSSRVALSASAYKAVATVNNPTPFLVSAGVSLNGLFRRADP